MSDEVTDNDDNGVSHNSGATVRRLQLGGDLRHFPDLDEVEVVEQPDPRDAEEHVQPLQDGGRIHLPDVEQGHEGDREAEADRQHDV